MVLTADGAEPIDDSTAEIATEDAVLSPSLRASVLARDGHRCRHCGCRRSLHVHHVTWRRHGGATAPPNLVTLCAKCHGLVHDGLIEVDTAPCATRDTAPRAAGGTAPFVFRDAHGARLDGWPLRGPRIRIEQAEIAPAEVAHGATSGDQVGVLDGSWLKDHLHWFADSRRGLVVKPEYRGALERLVAMRDAG